MKNRFLKIIIAVALCFIMSVTAFAAVAGDVTGDGKITASDARKVLRHSAGIELLSEDGAKAADVDGNGKITASDARKIMRESAGLTKNYQAVQVSGKLVEDGVLNVAICVSGVPFAYEENGELKGAAVDMAKKAASYYDLELKLQPMTSDEAAASLKNNKCDLAFIAVDCYNGKTPDGLVTYQYAQDIQNVYVKAGGNAPAVSAIMADTSKTIGIIKGSFADAVITKAVENGNCVCEIKRYVNVGHAMIALDNNAMTAFIGYSYASYKNITISENLASDNLLMAASAEKKELFDVFRKPLSDNFISSIVDKYAPAKAESSMTMEAEILILPEGATSIMKIDIDSYYGHANYSICPKIVSSTVPAEIVAKVINDYECDFYLVVSAPRDAKTGKVVLALENEPDVTFDLELQIADSYPVVYNFGKQNSMAPDFGSVVGTAPDEVDVYPERGIAYIYNVSSLQSAGVTDEHVNYFFTLLAYQGFEQVSDITGAGYRQIEFKQKNTGEVILYTENYGDDGDVFTLINIYLYREL